MMPRFRKAIAKADTRAEQLILQDAWLRSAVDECIPKDDFKESLKMRLAHGTYYDGSDTQGEGEPGFLERIPILRPLYRFLKLLGGVPALKYSGMACLYSIPVFTVFLVYPMMGRDISLSAIAAEMNTTLGARGSVHYRVQDSYFNSVLGLNVDRNWEVWKAGNYSYIESKTSMRSLRMYSTPTMEVLLDDTERTAKVTKYNNIVSDTERKAQFDLLAPLGTDGGLPVVSNLARRPITLRFLGTEEQDGLDCKTYAAGDGLKVWLDSSGSGYLKALDYTGAMADSETLGVGTGWVHTLVVKPIERDKGIAKVVFMPNIPTGYRIIETREVYSSLSVAKLSLCFEPNLPDDLWKTFEKPKAYAVSFKGSDAVLQMTLFRRNRNKDSASAIRLSQFRPAPLPVPVNGRVTDLDTGMMDKEPEFGTGYSVEWVSAGTHMVCSAKDTVENTEPDIAVVYEAVKARGALLPRM